MANQFVALYEETARGTKQGSALFLPIMGSLLPSFSPTDEPRKEYRGADTALGDLTSVRRESQWTYTLECAWYPGAETGLLFKHLLGKAGTRSVVDTSAYEGILYPLSMPYGTGAELADKAIGLEVNYDDGNGATKSRYYGGGRVKSVSISGEGTDDIKLSFELSGPGEHIGAESTETAGASFPTVSPFCASDILLYVGAGTTRTGTAPDYTALAPNTMPAFRPDSLSLTITSGLDDKVVMDGIKGPNFTTRTAQFDAALDVPIDWDDPSTGFSSKDEYDKLFAGVATNNFMIVADNGELAGAATSKYTATIDLPAMINQSETPTFSTEGQTPSVGLKYKSLNSTTTEYPLAMFTVDKATAY